MSRTLSLDSTVIDQFPVYEPDGIAKKSGLTHSDFTVNVYKDGAVQSTTVNISEISNGEYSLTFNPDDLGFWLVEVLIDYNNEWWFGEYDVVLADNSDLYELVRRVLGLSKENFVIDETEFDANNQQTECRIRIFENESDVDNATEGGASPPDPVPIAVYQMQTIWEGLNKIQFLKIKKT